MLKKLSIVTLADAAQVCSGCSSKRSTFKLNQIKHLGFNCLRKYVLVTLASIFF